MGLREYGLFASDRYGASGARTGRFFPDNMIL